MLRLKGIPKGTVRVKKYLHSLATSIVLVVVILSASFSALPALAANSTASGPGNGFRISPPRYELNIARGASQTVSIFVENLANSQVTAKPIVNDFVAGSQENGDPQLILDPAKSSPGNSFKPLVQSIPNAILAAQERKEIKVTLSVPANAAAGGYYGAIRFQPVYNSSSPANVSITASVGTLFLVTVPGNLTQKLDLASFNATHKGKSGSIFNSGPISIVTRLHNAGNIHVQPFGKILVKNTFGKVVATVELNNASPRGNVLPGTTRKFENALGLKHMLGRYTAQGNLAYGDNGNIISTQTTFYVIPYVLIIIVVLLIIFLIFILPRLFRWYNRRVVERSQKKHVNHPHSAAHTADHGTGPDDHQTPPTFQA